MSTTEWFKRAVPSPTRKNFHVQLGVHVEEFREMLESLEVDAVSKPKFIQTIAAIEALANELKTGVVQVCSADWVEFYDSIVDQRVTGTGLAYMIGADLPGGVAEVDASNESKFVDGQPVWDANGKIAKGPNYRRPDLSKFLPAEVTVLAK